MVASRFMGEVSNDHARLKSSMMTAGSVCQSLLEVLVIDILSLTHDHTAHVYCKLSTRRKGSFNKCSKDAST